MSLGNLILNAIGTGIIILIYLTNYQRHLREHNASLFLYFLIYLICFFLPALLVTLLFLYLEKISCCSCCVSPGKQLRVFDPDHPEKTFIMEEGRVVELMQEREGRVGIFEGKLTSAISIWTEAWSLAVMSLFVAEHFLGI